MTIIQVFGSLKYSYITCTWRHTFSTLTVVTVIVCIMGLGQILSPIYSIFRIYEAFFCPFQKLKTEKKSICKAHLAQKNQVWSRLKISAKINKANLRAILMDFIIRNENHIQISINLAKNDIFWRRYFGFWIYLPIWQRRSSCLRIGRSFFPCSGTAYRFRLGSVWL